MVDNNKPHSKFQHLYVIVRIDLPVNQQNPENSISVVKALSSKMIAEQEVSRLNKLNSEKGCRYVVQVTRMMPSVH
jgi:hypothetical protein